jgi:hypothetical protein
MILAAIGLPAMWAAFLLDPNRHGRRKGFRYGVAVALFLGLIADAYWIRLTVFSPPGPRSDILVTLFWAFLLLALMPVAVKYLFLWLRPEREEMQS